MRRDLDLIRCLLLRIEERGPGEYKPSALVQEGESEELVLFHIALLADAGFIAVRSRDGMEDWKHLRSSRGLSIFRMTSQGFDYLDSIRSDEIWSGVKGRITQESQAFPFELIKDLGISLIKQSIGLG